MLGSNLFLELKALIQKDPKVQALMAQFLGNDEVMLGLLAKLQHRLGKSNVDPTGGLLAPYLKGVTTRDAGSEYTLAFLARIQYVLDGVIDTIPLVVYEDDLRKSNNPSVVKFINADKDLQAADDAKAVALMEKATHAFDTLHEAAINLVVDFAQKAGHMNSGLQEFARMAMTEAHRRTKTLQPEAFLFLSHVTLVQSADRGPDGSRMTMSIGPSRKAFQGQGGSMAGLAGQLGLSWMQPVREAFERKKIGFAAAQQEGPGGGSFSGKNVDIELRYSPMFVVESVYSGVADTVINAMIADVAIKKFNLDAEPFMDLMLNDSMVDGVAAVLIHEAYHTLHGHNTPMASAYNKADKEFGSVFKAIVNMVGDALINQEILTTTKIPLMTYGGIIKSWDIDLEVSPEKLYHEVVEKKTRIQKIKGQTDPAIVKQVTDLAKECQREGVTGLTAKVTFSWPDVRGMDSRFFNLTRLFIRGVANKAKIDNRSMYDKIKDALKAATDIVEEAIATQQKSA